MHREDKLTRPVKVTLNVGFSTSGDWDPFDQYFYFTEGRIGIQKNMFDGKREAGGDVFLKQIQILVYLP